jgi:ABC-type Fe3+ transport system permease subunit
VGRGLRFGVVAFVAAHFGTQIFRFFSRYYKPALYTLIVLAVLGGIAAVVWYRRYRREHPSSSNAAKSEPKKPGRKVA